MTGEHCNPLCCLQDISIIGFIAKEYRINILNIGEQGSLIGSSSHANGITTFDEEVLALFSNILGISTTGFICAPFYCYRREATNSTALSQERMKLSLKYITGP